MTTITSDQLLKIFNKTNPTIVNSYVEPMNKTFSRYIIDTPRRISMFLAQVGHESGGLTAIQENLNYSADRLSVVFPKYFKDVDPSAYARNPEKIANRVYASRMGNGPESSGDGYRYRGRGLIQLTGKSNYERFAKSMLMPLDQAVQYLTTPEGACMSAGWFWDVNNLNELSDDGDVIGCTRKINGGTNGLEDRQSHYTKALQIFGG
jgi:putative chitinase